MRICRAFGTGNSDDVTNNGTHNRSHYFGNHHDRNRDGYRDHLNTGYE